MLSDEQAKSIVQARWGKAGVCGHDLDRWNCEEIYYVGTTDGSRYGSGGSYEAALADCDSKSAKPNQRWP